MIIPSWPVLVAAALVLAVAGCQRGDERFLVNAFATTPDSAPVVETEDAALVVVEQRIELPIRPPSDRALERRMLLDPPDGPDPASPFPRLPWVSRGDLRIEVDWVLTNVSDPASAECPASTAQVAVVLNGLNEFFEYEPGFLLDDDEVIVNFAQWERLLTLAPGASVRGTIQERELDEVTVDLATLVNGAPNPNEVVFRDNQFDRDPDVAPFIPDVVPGLVGFKLGLRTTEPPTCLVLESTTRVRDLEGRLQDRGKEPWIIEPLPTLVTAEELLAAAAAAAAAMDDPAADPAP